MSRTGLDRLAALLMALARRLAPGDEREWLQAMRSEMDCLAEPRLRLRWAAGGLAAAARMRARSRAARFQGLCLAALALITVQDWRNPDPTATFLALVFAPGLLAFAEPRRRWGIGALFGLWLLAVHAAADLWPSLRPHYQRLPLSPAELLEIALLLAIAVPAAQLGALARR